MRGLGSGETNGVNDKWLRINQIVKESRLAVMAIQEAHLTREKAETLNDLFDSTLRVYTSPDPQAPTAARGVAFVINKRILGESGKAHTTEIVPGRAMKLTLEWEARGTLTITNIYAPNGASENAAFWRTLNREESQGGMGDTDVMLGDFNLVTDAMDRLPARNDQEEPVAELAGLIESKNLFDGWREENPTERGYTFLQDSTMSQSRIDRIYAKRSMRHQTAGWAHAGSGIRTDHLMTMMSIANYAAPHIGKGRWSIAKSVLADKEFCDALVKLGRATSERASAITCRDDANNVQVLYQSFKNEVKDTARKRSKALYAKWDKKIDKLRSAIREALNGNTESATLNEVEAKETAALLRDRLTKLEEKRFEGRRADLRIKQWVEGETMSKFWVNQGKARQTNTPFYELWPAGRTSGNLVASSKGMAEVAKKHYDGLQRDTMPDQPGWHSAAITEALRPATAKLSARQKDRMGKKLTRDQVNEAVMEAAKNKSAGLDGLPAELWQNLAVRHARDVATGNDAFDIIGLLKSVFNDIEENGVSPNTAFTDGWVCPIYKKGDKREISNYRPITVLNADYKMMTKAMATKLAEIAEHIIHPDQAGFVKGRKIHDNVKLTKLMVDYAEAEELGGVIVALDQEKAYDRINHEYLWEVMRHANFPRRFIRTVKYLYEAARSTVMLNGVMSEYFAVTRGVRQGDPMSCLLFNIAIEPLACSLRRSRLAGFHVPGLEERLITTLFADDTTVFLSEHDNYRDMETLLTTWCAASRAKFNGPKTELIPIGPKEYRERLRRTQELTPGVEKLPTGLKILNEGESTRMLGAWIGTSVNQSATWDRTIQAVKGGLDRWSKRKPTLAGKRLIVNMEVGGRTQYLARVQGMPPTVENKLVSMVSEFIWDGAKPQVALPTLAKNMSEGGIRLLDIKVRNEALDLMWLKGSTLR